MTDYRKYINALRKCAKEYEGNSTSTDHHQDMSLPFIISDLCHDVADLLELLLDQEPKTGYWNTYVVYQNGIDEEWLECSECKWSNALLIPRNYCPNCGCRMGRSE